MLVDFRKLLHYEQVNNLKVLVEPRQSVFIILSEFVVFQQRNEEPESHFLIAMHQQTPYNEIHALDIAWDYNSVTNIAVIKREGKQNTSEI